MTDNNFLNTTIDLLETFRKEIEGEKVSVHTLIIFLYIAKNAKRGILIQELEKLMNLPSSTIWRNAGILASGHGETKKALYLVSVAEDPIDRRRKTFSLTTKGNQLVSKLAKKLGGKLQLT